MCFRFSRYSICSCSRALSSLSYISSFSSFSPFLEFPKLSSCYLASLIICAISSLFICTFCSLMVRIKFIISNGERNIWAFIPACSSFLIVNVMTPSSSIFELISSDFAPKLIGSSLLNRRTILFFIYSWIKGGIFFKFIVMMIT